MLIISVLFEDDTCSTFIVNDTKHNWPPQKNIKNIKIFKGNKDDISMNDFNRYEGLQIGDQKQNYFLGRKMWATLMGNFETLIGIGYNINGDNIIIRWYNMDLIGVEVENRNKNDCGFCLKINS